MRQGTARYSFAAECCESVCEIRAVEDVTGRLMWVPCDCSKVHLTVMRVKTVDGEEYTGVYLPFQVAEHILDRLRIAEPELAEVRVAGGELLQLFSWSVVVSARCIPRLVESDMVDMKTLQQKMVDINRFCMTGMDLMESFAQWHREFRMYRPHLQNWSRDRKGPC